MATAAGRYRVLVLTLGYCGLRWGEASALRVHNIDLDRGRSNITDAVAEVNGHVVFGTPKSHQARWLPVPAFLGPPGGCVQNVYCGRSDAVRRVGAGP